MKKLAIIKKWEIRKMSREDLEKKLSELRKELIRLNTQRYQGSVEKPGRIKEIRRSIARILTMMKEVKRNK